MSDVMPGASAPVGFWSKYKPLWITLAIGTFVALAIVSIAAIGVFYLWARYMSSYG